MDLAHTALGVALLVSGCGVDGIVVVGVLRSVDDYVQSQCGDAPDDLTRQMVEQFPNYVLGSYCVPDMGVHLSKALDVIDAACERFTPPG